MRKDDELSGRLLSFLPYLLPALVLCVVVFVRIRLLTVPLERDEGEYAYIGQLMLKGIPPFTHAYTMKLPGVSAVYALFMLLFGQTPAGIHLGLLIVNGICILLVYLLARRLLDRNAALVSCTSYAVLSLSQPVFGVFAHATHFVVLFALSGFLLLLGSTDRHRYSILFISGLCFGLAVTMKQHAALLVVFAFLYLVWRGWRNPVTGKMHLLGESALFLLGTIIPYALIVLSMAKAGTLDKFWFWTVQYAREYASGPTLLQGMMTFALNFTGIITTQLLLWLLAACGGVFLCVKHGRCTDRLFVFGFVLFSFLSICPGLYFRAHYFVLLLPAVSVLIGAAVNSSGQLSPISKLGRFQQLFPYLLFIVAIGYGLNHEKEYLFGFTPLQVSRATYGSNPFPEAIPIARYLKDHTSPKDRIAVLGSEPEIYFYADRLSATGHIYMYGLMESQPYAEQMQVEMTRQIEAARPKYIVMTNVRTSWLAQPASSRILLNWGENYLEKQYELVGVIDVLDSDTTRYLWDGKATGYTPVSNAYLTVFKRKAEV